MTTRGRPSVRRDSLPAIDRELRATKPDVSPEVAEYVRGLLERNRQAIAAMGKTRLTGDCSRCHTNGLLYRVEPTDADSPVACARCVRVAARGVRRATLCDNDPDHGVAWRNPYTRRNEYLCGSCHAASGDGVVQNRYARVVENLEPRHSLPLGAQAKALCNARHVPGTKQCQGEVKPRGRTGTLLCNAHAGKQSASGDYFD